MINGRQSQKRSGRYCAQRTRRRFDNKSSISGRDNSAAAIPITPEIDEIDRRWEGGRAEGTERHAA